MVRTETGDVEQTVMLIGGWSKDSYLTELNLFYPRKNKLSRWCNSIKLQAPDMVTKRPIAFGNCLYALGR